MNVRKADFTQFPLVSVITPSYNALPYIVENIESIRAQDYPAIEHVVCDGGSTDGTREILQKYHELVWVSEIDRGQSHALNKGFRRAKGEIIGWLNADDSYQAGTISRAVRYFHDHQDVDLIYGDLQIIDELSRPVTIIKSQPFDLNELFFINYIKQPTVFMRRRVIDQMEGLNEDLHYVMDWELWLRYGCSFKFHYLPNHTMANFRLCPGTKSFDKGPEFSSEWCKVLQRVFQDPVFSIVKNSIKRKALKQAQSRYHIAKMIKAVEQQDRRIMLHHLAIAILLDRKLLFNRGIYLFASQGLLGHKVDRLRKYRE
jgi:glycosyltransferase involved in cell wall biosynthesis